MSPFYQGTAEVPPGRRAIALGTFDGVHLGHRAVVAAACAAAARLDAIACAAAFHPRPITILQPGTPAATLAGVTQRVRLLEQAGAEDVVLVRFTPALASLNAAAFVDEILVERLGAVAVVVGADFRFGRDREGSVETLRTLCSQRGIEVEAVTLLDRGGQKISSSRIRHCLREGDVEEAATLLGRLPSIEGTVIHGDKRGREIGFPTANISAVPGQQLPAEGVYAGWGVFAPGEQRVQAAISVGTNPHFGDVSGLRVEVHLIDYLGGELYGQTMRVEFAARLRGQATYDDSQTLVAQIAKDVADTRQLLKTTIPSVD